MGTPTQDFYGLLQRAYTFFNQHLFGGELPHALITAQREKNTMGYFAPERWASPGGHKAHEIALNPAYFAHHALIEIFQTLVHEQCHLWQHEFGQHKSRRGYHNKEWAEKMQVLGLTPSSTGMEGGRITGQKMSDYPTPGGRFLKVCCELTASGFQLPWVDRFGAPSAACQTRNNEMTLIDADTGDEPPEHELLYTQVSVLIPDVVALDTIQLAARARQKVRYHCHGCNTNLWGKPELNVLCGNCDLPYQAE
ncbi:MAG TPA: sprT domain-containing protein [Gammaproteobacteria bacterium]|nr:sprT domain-containing protein [Gammaproteobacteria bacterium]